MAGERVRRLVTSFSSSSEANGGRTARSILADLQKTKGGSELNDSGSLSLTQYAELWDGLDACMEQANGTRQSTKDLATGLVQWSAAEKDYISKLPFTKKKFELPECEAGTLGETLESFCSSFMKIAEARARLSSVVGAMGTQLQQFRREQNQTKRKLELEGAKLRKGMQAQEQSFQRAKQKYEKACRDAEQCIALKEKAHQEKALHEVSKLWQRTTDALIAVQESEQQYRVAVEELRTYRSTYAANMRRVLEELQILEESRIEYIKALIHGVVDSYTELANQSSQIISDLQEKVQVTESKKDIERFVKRNIRPPLEPVVFEKHANPKIDTEIEILVGGGLGISGMSSSLTSNTSEVKPQSFSETNSSMPKEIVATTSPNPASEHGSGAASSSGESPKSVFDSPNSSFTEGSKSMQPSPGGPRVRAIPPRPGGHSRSNSLTTTFSSASGRPLMSPRISTPSPRPVLAARPVMEQRVLERPGTTSSSETKPPEVQSVRVDYVRLLYDYTADEAGELTVRAGDIIEVIEKDASGWWEGKSRDGTTGSFPENYTHMATVQEALDFGFPAVGANSEQIEEIENSQKEVANIIAQKSTKFERDEVNEQQEEEQKRESLPGAAFSHTPPSKQVIAIFDYEAQDPYDLTIKKREILVVHGIDKDGGWLDASNAKGNRGMVPANYVRSYNRPQSAISA